MRFFRPRIALIGIWLFVASARFAFSADQEQKGERSLFEERSLFKRGEDSYHCFRIPSILVTPHGAILAFAEARKNNCEDHGDVDLAMKRSLDGGRTWSRLRVIADDRENTMGNPCPVVDHETAVI